jgi:hypothetical protein
VPPSGPPNGVLCPLRYRGATSVSEGVQMKAVAAASAVLVLTLPACTSDQDASGATPPGDTSSQTSEASADPTTEPSETETAEPLTGPVMRVEGISLQLPQGWHVSFETSVSSTAGSRAGTAALGVLTGEQWPLDRLLKSDLRVFGDVADFHRLPDVTVDGNPAYHYTGRPDSLNVRESYGFWDDGYQVVIDFELARRLSPAKRRELVDSVMATYDSPT